MTILYDALGNRLAEGQLLRWKSTGLVVRVKEIRQGGLTLMHKNSKQGTETNGQLVLEVPLGFKPEPQVQFQDFDRVVDPASEAIIEGALTPEREARNGPN